MYKCQCPIGQSRRAILCLGVSVVQCKALKQRPAPQNKLLLEVISAENTGECSELQGRTRLHSKHLSLVRAEMQPWILLHTQLFPDALAQIFSWCILLLPECACSWVGVPCSQWS